MIICNIPLNVLPTAASQPVGVSTCSLFLRWIYFCCALLWLVVFVFLFLFFRTTLGWIMSNGVALLIISLFVTVFCERESLANDVEIIQS